MKNTKKRLFFSILSLTLCISMLLGTTYAWFTDFAASNDNIIKAGQLNAEMYWSDSLLPADSAEWQNADGVPIFTADDYEPGCTEVKYIKVVNAGNLSFKWKLSIEAEGEVGKLADVIDVYYVNPVTGEVTSVAGRTKAGTLSSVIANHTYTDGVLLPEGEVSNEYLVQNTIIAIAFNMQTTAGNEYQNSSVGDGFTLKLLAAQFNYEKDSSGSSDYDKDAPYQDTIKDSEGSSPVVPDNGQVPTGGMSIDAGNGITAYIPEGVHVTEGASALTLSVTNMNTSGSNVLIGENNRMTSIDVHIDGVASTNTVPMEITIKEAAAKGLNAGSFNLYHVENGETITMTPISINESFTAHNQFKYDPATGDVIMNLASFSEIVLLTNTKNAWEGNFDYSWYDATATELYIANADQLAAFGGIVGGMKKVTGRADGKYTYSDEVIQDSFEGKTVNLVCDIYIGDVNTATVDASENGIVFYPIGYWNNEGTYDRLPADQRVTAVESGFYAFMGTFDGNGHVISDWYQNTWEMKGDHNWYSAVTEQYYRDGMGLFGKIYKGTVKNLTIDNFSSDGEITTTGAVAAYADGATFENIAIYNCNPRVYNIGNGGIVGCVGWYSKEANLKTTFTNITVDNSNKISALWGSYDVPCGGIVGQYYPTSGQSSANYPENGGIHFENCHVGAQIDVYNDVCANYQYYAYRYAGILMGSVRENVTIDGHEYPDMTGITANDCTVHFGDWNDYYYCELVANSLASYTHDHQMSRLEQVASVDVENKTYVPLNSNESIAITGTKNFVVVKSKSNSGEWIHGDGHEYADCYHFVDGKVWNHADAGTETVNGVEGILKEDKQCVYREFNNLITGYGWGVTSKGVADMKGVTIFDETNVSPDSVEKFTPNTSITTEENNFSVHLGELFQAKAIADKYAIKSTLVKVTVTNINDDGSYNPNGKVIAKYVRNDDWTKSTLTFTGTGKVQVTIQDYFYCIPTSMVLEITEAAPKIDPKLEELYSNITAAGNFNFEGGSAAKSVGIDKEKTQIIDNKYIRVTSLETTPKTNTESYFYLLYNNIGENAIETGKYVVIKYRVSELKDPNYSFNSMQIYTSEVDQKADGENAWNYSIIKTDGEWRVAVFDLSAFDRFNTHFTSENERYFPNFIRIDLLNNVPAGQTIDIEFITTANSIPAIQNFVSNKQSEISYDSKMKVSSLMLYTTSAHPQYIPVYDEWSISEESKSYITNGDKNLIATGTEYVTCIDYINIDGNANDSTYSSAYTISGTKLTTINFNRPVATKLSINGWTIMDGGIEDYYWSADNGKTWNKIARDPKRNASTGEGSILNAANFEHYGDYMFTEADVINGAFQSVYALIIDFTNTDYVGKTIDKLIIAAEPIEKKGNYCILTVINGVEVKGAGYENYADVDRFIADDSAYIRSDKEYAVMMDSINGVSNSLSGTSADATIHSSFNTNFGTHTTANSLKCVSNISIKGWAMVNNGGIEKFVWSYDGKTWYDVKSTASNIASGSDIITSSNGKFSSTNPFDVSDGINGIFQQGSLFIDFTQLIEEYPYLNEHNANITVAAVPVNDANPNDGKTELCILYRLVDFRICKSTTEEAKCGATHVYSDPKYVVGNDGYAVIETACQCGNDTNTRIPYRVMHIDNLYINDTGATTFKAANGEQKFGNNHLISYDLNSLKYPATYEGKFRFDGWIGMEDRIAGVKYRVLDSSGNVLEDWTKCGILSVSSSDLTNALALYNIDTYEGHRFTSNWIDLSQWLGTFGAKGAYENLTVEFAFVSTGALQDGLAENQALVYLGAFTNINLGCKTSEHTEFVEYILDESTGYITTVINSCACGANYSETTVNPKYMLYIDRLGVNDETAGKYAKNFKRTTETIQTLSAGTNVGNANGEFYVSGWAGIENELTTVVYRIVYNDSTEAIKTTDWVTFANITDLEDSNSVNSSLAQNGISGNPGKRFNGTLKYNLTQYFENGMNPDGITIEFAFVYAPAYEQLGNDALIYAGEITGIMPYTAQ